MTGDEFIGRLEKARGKAPRWTACCPAHDDHSPSLTIREEPDGRILIHCFAGCSADEIVAALGLELSDIMPPRALGDRIAPNRRAFSAADALECIDHEAMLLLLYVIETQEGRPLTNEAERARVVTAVSRISAARDFINGQR